MTWLWPGFLFGLVLIPLLIVAYIWALRRRRSALRYSSLTLLRPARPQQSWLRRHLPFALLLLGLTSLILGLARPQAVVAVPTNQTTIILAIDVSGSMRSTDIQPSRIEAAEAAALNFIQQQKSSTQIGIVAFSGDAELVQPPTTDQEALQAAIYRLSLGRATAIGSGILKSIDAIAEIDKNVAPSVTDLSPTATPTPVPQGLYAPDIIVLLTDGVSNAGPAPLDAAQQAADRGIRVYTIGFGTENGGFGGGGRFGGGGGGQFGGPFGGGQFGGGGGGQFGGPFGGGGRFRMGIDETTLKQVAALTGGTYYSATSAGQLQNVFQNLPTYLITKHEFMEITVGFTAVGAFLAMIAIALAISWNPLP